MALVLSADVIDAGLQRLHALARARTALGHARRFLICLTPRANFERIDGHARRKTQRVFIATYWPRTYGGRSIEADRKLLEQGLAKVREDGAQVEVLEGEDAVETIVRYARSHGVTQIFVGHSVEKDSERECSEALSAAWSGLREASTFECFLTRDREPNHESSKTPRSPENLSGYAAGVGKTYQCFRTRMSSKARGVDLVLAFFGAAGPKRFDRAVQGIGDGAAAARGVPRQLPRGDGRNRNPAALP